MIKPLQTDFLNKYASVAQTAIAFKFNEEFSKILQRQMDTYNGPNADQIATVGNKIEDVKNIMVDNIEKVGR